MRMRAAAADKRPRESFDIVDGDSVTLTGGSSAPARVTLDTAAGVSRDSIELSAFAEDRGQEYELLSDSGKETHTGAALTGTPRASDLEPEPPHFLSARQSDVERVEHIARLRGEIDVAAEAESHTAPTRVCCCHCSFRTLWQYCGPGWLVSISYLDPGNLEADLQAGAFAGYQLLWMLAWSTCAGFLLQVLAARLGTVTGKNLAEVCRLEFSRPTSFMLWIVAEAGIIGSDIQEVFGSAVAFQLLFGWPLWVGCLVTGFDTFTFLAIQYFGGVRRLEAFFAALILTMIVCFSLNFALTGPRWSGVPSQSDSGGIMFGTSVPTCPGYAISLAVGLLGAVIMPHNLYMHSALVQSRKIDRASKVMVTEACKYNTIETAMALLISFLVNAAVVSVFAHGFFDPDQCAQSGWDLPSYNIAGQERSAKHNLGCYPGNDDHSLASCRKMQSADGSIGFMNCSTFNGRAGVCCGIGLKDAGSALEGLLPGGTAKVVWAIGLLAAGQASTMTSTFAGQFVMEGFLDIKVAAWKRVAITRAIALVPSMVFAVGILGSEDANIGDIANKWLNILQSITLPFALLPVLHFTSSVKVMGTFANNKAIHIATWLLASLIIVINAYLVHNFITDSSKADDGWFYVVCASCGCLYVVAMVQVIRELMTA